MGKSSQNEVLAEYLDDLNNLAIGIQLATRN